MIFSKKWQNWMLIGSLILVAFAIGRVTVGDPGDEEVTEEEAQDVSTWTCPMHPQIQEPEFGTCPICHMDLVPADEAADDDGAVELATARHTEVEVGRVTSELDVFGRIEVDEETEVDIAAWTGGRIERLEVSARGERVERGQLLARVYSPELYAAQRTLVQAVRSKQNAEETGSDRRVRAARSSIEAARTELRLLGVDTRQIDEIEESMQPRETVDIFATASGTIRQRHVQSGDYVAEGDTILSLAPLDTVWGQLEIYERDLQRVAEGMPVEVRVPALDGEKLEGRIDFISPEIDGSRRVAHARVVLPNPEGRLKPGMYLDGAIEISVEGDDILSVPRSAVLWTGHRSLVYLYDDDRERPGYLPQPVELGPRMGERYIIDEGLSAGDRVAERGAFRIDSELQLRGGASMMSTAHADEVLPVSDDETVDVPTEGVEFDPPIDPEQLPKDRDLWYCDMGTVEWAQGEEGDGECPVCGMDLTHREAEGNDEGDPQDHDHDHDHGGHDHVH